MKRLIVALLMIITSGLTTAIAADGVELTAVDAVTNFFPNKPWQRPLAITAENEPWTGEIQWRLLANQRTLFARSVPLELKGNERKLITAEGKLPDLAAQVSFPLEFVVEAVAKPGDKPLATLREKLWLLAENPFEDRRQALQKLPLTLFDPEGATREALDALEVPYEFAKDLNAITNCKQGVLVLGEGITYRHWQGVIDESLQLASRGVSVICLAAAVDEDLFPWESPLVLPFHKLRLERRDILRELDPRISLAWSSTAPVELHPLTLANKNNEVFVRSTEPKLGWPWLELRPAKTPYPTWVYCGFGMIRDWNHSPAARHFFVRLVDYVTAETPCKPLMKEEVKP